MPGDYFIAHRGRRIGRVMRFAGEPPASRWFAYSIHEAEQRAFPTRKAAAAWLVERDETEQRSASTTA